VERIMFGLGPVEIVVIGAVAVMLYGKRLPEVGKSVGQSIGELRKQFATLQRDMDISSHLDPRTPARRPAGRRSDDTLQMADDRTAPRFEPPPAAEG
jgi:sec-independent protein translocase protein TatA